MKTTLALVSVLLALILSACTKTSTSPDLFSLKTPEGEFTAINHKPVKIGLFEGGQLTITCERSTEAKIRGDQPLMFATWQHQFDAGEFKILLAGRLGETTFEAILRKGTVEIGRTLYSSKTGFDFSKTKWNLPVGETLGTLQYRMHEAAANQSFDSFIIDVGWEWSKVSNKYSCSLPE